MESIQILTCLPTGVEVPFWTQHVSLAELGLEALDCDQDVTYRRHWGLLQSCCSVVYPARSVVINAPIFWQAFSGDALLEAEALTSIPVAPMAGCDLLDGHVGPHAACFDLLNRLFVHRRQHLGPGSSSLLF